ncbi:MAG: DUF3887 domain-containing protein [Lachnospiraceae bacterium]|nr:DUF3887 domain-containing protein [Lachnospiraceae bacterium]
MKKRIINVALVLCLFLNGCNSNISNNINTDKETNVEGYSLSELSLMYCEEMVEGKFDNIVNDFSSELSAQVNKQTLKQVWNNYTSNIGEYSSEYEITEKSENTLDVSLKFKDNGLKVSLSFDENKKITGIYLNYCDANSINGKNEDADDSENKEEKYRENHITIGEYNVDGILTLPVSGEKCPVVVMVQGSGQSDYNEKSGDVKPFEDIAIGLAENGIASIRINKRFYQYPELYSDDATIYDEVLNDIYDAIDYVENDKKIDTDRIYLLGHSLGAMLGPKIINEKKSICGFISMAGSPRKLEDIILDQNKEYLSELDIEEKEKEKQLQEVIDIVEKIKNIDESSRETLLGASAKYWISLDSIDYKALSQNVTIPVLALQGDEDKQISVGTDFSELKQIFSENGEYILYEGLDHLFMKDGETRVDDKVIEDIIKWIKG